MTTILTMRLHLLALLLTAAFVVPFVSLSVYALVYRRDLHQAKVTSLGFGISLLMTTLATDILKNAVGRPRPDLLSRCQPEPNTPSDELVTIGVCTRTQHHVLHDGWRSWPSGHTSLAFAGLGWFALLIASQTHAVRRYASFTTILFSLLPLICAALIGISRLEDCRHDVGDVLIGGLLGSSVAYLNWRRYYPSLATEGCEEPFPAPGGGYYPSPMDINRIHEEEVGLVTADQTAMEARV